MDANAVRLRAEAVERKFTAVLEVPNARKHWKTHFEVKGEGPTMEFSVPTPIGDQEMNFTAQLVYFDFDSVAPEFRYSLSEEDYTGFELRMKLECEEASYFSFKNVKGKLMVEFLNREEEPFKTFEFSTKEFLPVLRHPKRHKFNLATLKQQDVLRNLGAGDCLTMRLTFTFVETRVGVGNYLRA